MKRVRKSDMGFTCLINGRGCRKSDLRIKTMGLYDLAGSLLGLAKTKTKNRVLKQALERTQKYILSANSDIAGLKETKEIISAVVFFESEIKRIKKALAPIKSFVLQGKNEVSALIHCARAVARLAESELNSAVKKGEIRAFANRLSEYLFYLAEFSAK